MKKLLFSAFLLLSAIGQLGAQTSAPYQYNGVTYLLDHVNSEATVTSGSYSGTVNIPDYITTAKGLDYDVVAIGQDAFRNCSGLTSVTIATGVESIGANAFYGCSSLTSIKIPNSVTELGDGVFRGCSRISSVTFSSNLTSLPDNCFYGCSSLKEITLPRKITMLGAYCFYGCSSLSSLSYSTVLVSIGNSCFQSCTSLTSTTLPNTLTNLGNYAFSGCSKLSSIKLNEGLLRMGNYVLSDCTALTDITLPSTLNELGDAAFRNDNQLANAQMGRSQLTSLSANLFQNCSALSIVELPSSLTTISGYAFSGCTKLPSLVFPAGLVSVTSTAFNNCSNLKQLTFSEGMTTIPRTYVSAVQQVNFPTSATAIAENAFYGCSALTGINLPQRMASIGNSAFNGCSTLPSLTLPASLTSMGTDAFANCGNLTHVEYAEGTRVALRTYANKLTSVTIPSTCEAFADNIFSGCSALSRVNIRDLEMWNFLFQQRTTASPFECDHYIYLNDAMLTDLLADFGAPIASYAFSRTKGLENVTLMSTIGGVNDNAFAACTDLKNVTMSNTVRSVGANAFQGCNSLESVRLGNGVAIIRNNAFYGCTALTSMRLGGNEREIGNSAFEGCSALQTIKLPATLTSLGAKAFRDCKRLTEISLPQGITELGAATFQNCLVLTSATLPDQLVTIGDQAFDNCPLLEIISIPDATETIGTQSFNQCKALNYVYVGSGLKTIGSNAFANCVMLKAFYCMVTTPPSVNSNAFSGSDPSSIMLYVPDETADTYRSKNPWSTFAASQGLSAAPIYANSITLDPAVLIMSDNEEDETKLTWSLLPANATNGKVTWTSSNTSVATVSRTGLVSPITEGVATITCTAQDKHGARATTLVIVANNFKPVTSLSLDRTTLTLTEGETLQLVPTTLPNNATHDVLDWTSSDENIATISEAGIVTAVNAGQVTLTASTTDGSKKVATCRLTVKAPDYASFTAIGDVDSNGWISGDDVMALTNLLLGQRGGIDSSFDVNKDGRITITDIAAVIAAMKRQTPVPAGPTKLIRPSAAKFDLVVGEHQTINTTVVPFRAAGHLRWTTSDAKIVRIDNAMGGTCNFTTLAPGQVIITVSATDGTGISATVLVNVAPNTRGTTDDHEWVDLGLPSGTRWAVANMGAEKAEDYGDYIAWGEKAAKQKYDWTTYTLCNGSATTLTKYCTASASGQRDDKAQLEADDDAATMWSARWAMPTHEQLAELFDSRYTKTEWTTQGGINGRKVTSRLNGSSIFLPAAGYKNGTSTSSKSSGGYYASANLANDPKSAYVLNFGSSTINADNETYRSYGLSVRPVLKPAYSLSIPHAELVVGQSYSLARTISFTDGRSHSLTWSVENTSVATITASGTVTAQAAGETCVYATTADGVTATIRLVVHPELEITPKEVSVGVGASLQFKLNTIVSAIWSTSNAAVATVSNTGVVTGISEGNVAITALSGGKKAVLDLRAIYHEYVDLGLSVKWATCNVGAENPEDYGDYYAWGETQTKSDYSWSTYLDSPNRDGNSFTKYKSGGKTELDLENDVAHVQWGGSWRMPTDDEFTELRNTSNCTWTWTNQGGKNGYKVTSKKNGNSIFLPAAGCRYGSNLGDAGSYGFYWPSSLSADYSDRAYELCFDSGGVGGSSRGRGYGRSVRPVCE